MATHPTPAPAAATMPREIRIISHSNLFYWWPVWVVGFLLGIISHFSGYVLSAVPYGTIEAKTKAEVTANPAISDKDSETKRTVFSSDTTKDVKKGTVILYHPDSADEPEKYEPKLTHIGIMASRGPGVIFCTILLVVILITNIHLRGVWSFVVILVIVFLIVVLALTPGAMDWILTHVGLLDVRISTGAYFLISGVLLGIWLVIFFLFDPQTYMEFTPGQFRVKLEIGEGITAYDTRGMTVHKVRSDFFRHWILGMGSGDLIVRTTGAQAHEFNLPNVLFISQKVAVIEEMIAAAGR